MIPVAKTAEMAIFLSLAIFSVQTIDIGMNSIAMSDTELKIADASPRTLPLTSPVALGPTNQEIPAPKPMM